MQKKFCYVLSLVLTVQEPSGEEYPANFVANQIITLYNNVDESPSWTFFLENYRNWQKPDQIQMIEHCNDLKGIVLYILFYSLNMMENFKNLSHGNITATDSVI